MHIYLTFASALCSKLRRTMKNIAQSTYAKLQQWTRGAFAIADILVIIQDIRQTPYWK